MIRIYHLMVLFVALVTQYADACQSLPPERYASTEKRVRERFDSAEAVELVTLQRAGLIKVKEGGIDFEMDAERAVFRVDRVFKGKSKPGDTLVSTSSSSCAFSVVENPKFKYVLDAFTGKPEVPIRQWLIYRNAKHRIEITDLDLTRPISQAFADIEILERISGTRR